MAAEILEVGAGNFAVGFTTPLIACPFKTDSLHAVSCRLTQQDNQSLQTLVHLCVLLTRVSPWGSFSLAVTLLTLSLRQSEGHTTYTYSYSALQGSFHEVLMSYCVNFEMLVVRVVRYKFLLSLVGTPVCIIDCLISSAR